MAGTKVKNKEADKKTSKETAKAKTNSKAATGPKGNPKGETRKGTSKAETKKSVNKKAEEIGANLLNEMVVTVTNKPGLPGQPGLASEEEQSGVEPVGTKQAIEPVTTEDGIVTPNYGETRVPPSTETHNEGNVISTRNV